MNVGKGTEFRNLMRFLETPDVKSIMKQDANSCKFYEDKFLTALSSQKKIREIWDMGV